MEEIIKRLSLLESEKEILLNRIKILELEFERFKKAHLSNFFTYSTEEDNSDNECNNSDCSECAKNKWF